MKGYTDLLNLIGMPIEFKDSISKQAKFKNTKEFELAFARYYLLAFNRFRMKEGTCPDTIDERTVKNAVLSKAMYCQWLQDGVPLALPCTKGGSISFYGYPASAYVFARNGWNREIKCVIPGGDKSDVINQTIYGTQAPENEDKGFIVKCNELAFPLISFISSYALRVSNVMRTLDVQLERMKTPGFVVASEEVAHELKKIREQIMNNEELINIGLGAKDALQKIDYLIPSDVHHETKADYEWFDHIFLNLLGFGGNASPDKGAQLTEDEVHSDNVLSSFSIQTMVDYLNYQQKFPNELHGTIIEWEVVEPEIKMPEQPEQPEQKEESEVKEDE